MSYVDLKGNVSIASAAGSTTTIGNTTSLTTINAVKIQQNILTQDGTIIQNIVGNSDQSLSMSTHFNHKVSSSGTAVLNCFRVQNGNGNEYVCQYCELILGGGNAGLGSFGAKFGFYLYKLNGLTQLILTNTTNYGSQGGVPGVGYSIVNENDIYITVSPPATSTNQKYCATLIAYPTGGYGIDTDLSITAV